MDIKKEKIYKELVMKYLDSTERSKVFEDVYKDMLVYVYDVSNSENCYSYSSYKEIFDRELLNDISDDIFDLGIQNMPFSTDEWNFIIENSPYLTKKIAEFCIMDNCLDNLLREYYTKNMKGGDGIVKR